MGTILRWREPGTLKKEALRKLSLWARVRRRVQAPFMIGAGLGLFLVAIDGGFPKDASDVLRTIWTMMFFGVLFGVVYGVASLLPVRILVRHDHIGRQHAESYTRFEYKNFRDFRIEPFDWNGDAIELLTLIRNDGTTVTFELAPDLDRMKLEEILIQEVRERQLSV